MHDNTHRILKALEYHHKAVMLRTRAAMTSDAPTRSTYLLLAAYWEDKAKQAESDWLPAESASASED
jgi:hypothetical protein